MTTSERHMRSAFRNWRLSLDHGRVYERQMWLHLFYWELTK